MLRFRLRPASFLKSQRLIAPWLMGAGLLAACTPGVSSQAGVSGRTIASVVGGNGSPQWLYRQTNQDGVDNIYVSGNATVCREGGLSITQWFGNKYAADNKLIPIEWNVGDFSGFYPSNNHASQRGLTNAQYGGTAIQIEGGTSGWQIETTTAAPANADGNFIAGIISNHGLCDGKGGFKNLRPFEKPDTILRYSIDLQVPYSNNSAGSVNTAAQMVYMTDPTVQPAGLGFWYSFANYSSVDQSEVVIYDEGTNSAIVGSFPGYAGKYATDMGGAKLQRETWKGFKTFHVAMTAQNLKNAIAGLKAKAAATPNTHSKYLQLSDDPSVYIFGGGILDTEVARAGGHDGGMGLSSKNASIALFNGGSGCGGKTQITWTCGNGKPGPEWVEQANGCYQYDTGRPCQDTITGYVDSVATVNGKTQVKGWACAIGAKEALGVNIYAGTGPGSVAIGGGAAWEASEPAVGKACGDATNSPHRFTIDIDPAKSAPHRGQKLYVFGIYGAQTGVLGNSGALSIP